MFNKSFGLGVLYLTLTSAAAPSIITSLPGAVVVDGKTAGLPTLTLDRSMTLTRHVGLLTRAASLSLLACSVPAKSGGLDPAELTSIEVTPTNVTMAPNSAPSMRFESVARLVELSTVVSEPRPSLRSAPRMYSADMP